MIYRFTIDGPLMGAVRQTRWSKFTDPRAKLYHVFQNRVRALATKAGVPFDVPKRPGFVLVGVIARYKGAVRIDADNLWKGIVDGIWKHDKRVKVKESIWFEGCSDESAEISVIVVEP